MRTENGCSLTVGVAMATYNGDAYLTEQLGTLAGQTRLPDELVVYDDCSTDGTVESSSGSRLRHPSRYGWSVLTRDAATPTRSSQRPASRRANWWRSAIRTTCGWRTSSPAVRLSSTVARM